VVEDRGRQLVSGIRCRRRRRCLYQRRLGLALVDVDMHMHGGRSCYRGCSWPSIGWFRHLLRCGLVCSVADVAGELFQEKHNQRHDQSGCGKGELGDGIEYEPHDIHL
jgi:hypothetical protein